MRLRNVAGHWASGLTLTAADLTDRHQYFKFRVQPTAMLKGAAGAVPAGTTGAVNLLTFPGGQLEQHILGAGQTLIVPTIAADGLLVSLDLTNNEGAEYCGGITARSPSAFVVGTDPAFFFRVRLKIADVSGTDLCAVGFRKQSAYGAFDDYTDLAALNVVSGDIKLSTILNNAATVTTDTTLNWADGETKELRVDVSAAGVVTYKVDGVAPPTVATLTLDAGDVLTPMFHFLHDATTPGAIHLDYWECGLGSAG